MGTFPKNQDDQYSDEEAKRRFEAALRGAREVGHEAMKDIPPKRSTLHAATKTGKRKAKTRKSTPKRNGGDHR
jgi:hypothetical protein